MHKANHLCQQNRLKSSLDTLFPLIMDLLPFLYHLGKISLIWSSPPLSLHLAFLQVPRSSSDTMNHFQMPKSLDVCS